MNTNIRQGALSVLFVSVLSTFTACQHLGRITGHATKAPESPANASTDLFQANRKSFDAKPSSTSDVQIAMGDALENQGRLVEAEASFKAAQKNHPTHFAAHYRLALLHDKQGRVEESNQLYARALELNPENAALCADYGYSLYVQNKFSDAEQLLTKALTLDSNLVQARTNLGLALAKQGRGQQALQHFIQAGCSPSQAKCNVAVALLTAQRMQEAEQYFAAALQEDGNLEVARIGLASIRKAATGSQVAQASYQESVEPAPVENRVGPQPQRLPVPRD